jgi:subtilisin family serine protease
MRHRRSLRSLAAAIGIACAGIMPASGADAPFAIALSTAPATYIVRFAEAGVMHYGGGVGALAATAPAGASRKVDTHNAPSRAYERYLLDQRARHVDDIERSLGRALAVSHRYAVTMNGIAATMSAEEAARVARLPGVASVRAARVMEPQTFRGPEFVHADAIWSGASSPLATRGDGIVVGVVDSGSYAAHPSFADDPTCGFGGDRHKLLSTVDCTTTDANGACNGPTPEAEPGNGHGVHTASTVLGNRVDANSSPAPNLPPQHASMSGVAPCAQLRTYKVCPSAGCPEEAIVAGIENAIADRVDVVNYSIGPTCGVMPGQSPWSDGDEIWIDAVAADIFVAAAAGNTRGGCGDPVGHVSNNGAWVATVAASTHDENVSSAGLLSAVGPGSPPANTRTILLAPGSGLDVGPVLHGVEMRRYAVNPIGCTINGGFPPGYFAGAIALIARGACAYEEKIDNAQAAGALVAIVYNNQSGYVSMGVGDATLPAYSILASEGQAFVDFIDASAPAPVTVDFSPASAQGDVLAAFSLRGPDVIASVTKPDLTAPGVNIYAALDSAEGNYGYLSGTSMSSPHVAGAGALLRSVHPEWTGAEVKSALMLTASNAGGTKENGATPWTPDDVGNGRIDLSRAALAGFVLDENAAAFRAADPAQGGDPSTLNLPSLRDLSGCDAPHSCTWTRTLRDALPHASSWSVAVDAPDGLAIDVEPSTIAFDGTGTTPDGVFTGNFDASPTRTITITATSDPALGGIAFGDIVFHEASGAAPDAHMPVAVQGTNPDGGPFGVDCAGGDCTFRIDAFAQSPTGAGCSLYCGLVWLNRFTPQPSDYPITITSIDALFGNGAGWNAEGDHINFYIYQDDDADPSNGAALVGTYRGYAMPVPINNFTTIELPTPVVVAGPGDVLIALTNRAPNQGTYPASADQGPFAERSWLGAFTDDGVHPPDLAVITLKLSNVALDGFNGNWLIRAHGTNAAGQPIVLGMPAHD